MDCLPTPQFCLDFLLRSKTYWKEHPPSSSIANRAFPLLSKDVVHETGLHALKRANYMYTALQWFILINGV